MSNGYYSVAQICRNGHTASQQFSPDLGQKFCGKCGEETITECTFCASPIRGLLITPGKLRPKREYNPPSYCYECGKAYPWTEEKLNAAKDLAELLDELSEAEREQLKMSLDDLVADGPRTIVAQTRFKRILSKTGPEIATGFKDILVDVVSETVKKSLWGN
jgi:hypothetical protein